LGADFRHRLADFERCDQQIGERLVGQRPRPSEAKAEKRAKAELAARELWDKAEALLPGTPWRLVTHQHRQQF
jgi:hypothetical protein